MVTADFVAQAGIPRPTARRILNVLRENGVLKTVREGKGRRTGVFAYAELLNIAEGRKVF
jgi:DNA-binding IclR family transcriptional regulator